MKVKPFLTFCSSFFLSSAIFIVIFSILSVLLNMLIFLVESKHNLLLSVLIGPLAGFFTVYFSHNLTKKVQWYSRGSALAGLIASLFPLTFMALFLPALLDSVIGAKTGSSSTFGFQVQWWLMVLSWSFTFLGIVLSVWFSFFRKESPAVAPVNAEA